MLQRPEYLDLDKETDIDDIAYKIYFYFLKKSTKLFCDDFLTFQTLIAFIMLKKTD